MKLYRQLTPAEGWKDKNAIPVKFLNDDTDGFLKEDGKILEFIKLVVKSIQTDHHSHQDCTIALTKVLNEADKIHKDLTGEVIVKRGNRGVLDALVSQPLAKIK